MDVNVEDDLFIYCYDYQVLLDNNISLTRYIVDTPVSSTNKTDRHDITETLAKVALSTIQ